MKIPIRLIVERMFYPNMDDIVRNPDMWTSHNIHHFKTADRVIRGNNEEILKLVGYWKRPSV